MRDAAYEGRADLVRALLDGGMPLNDSEYGHSEALSWAIYGNHLDLIRELLARGADLEINSTVQNTVIAAAAYLTRPYPGRPADFRALELLLAAGARLRLQEAVLLNDLDLARTRLEEGADPNFGEGEYSGPVLMIAANEGFTAMVDLLLDFGADIEGKDDLWQYPLMCATARGRTEVVRRLLERGALLDAGWPHQTALSEAIKEGHLDLYHWLLQQGAKRSPLEAVLLGDLVWLEENLDTAIQNKGGIKIYLDSPLGLVHTAVELGNVAIVQALLQRSPDLSESSFNKKDLLPLAARCGHLDIIRLLLGFGADPNVMDYEGLTPLAWAIRENQTDAAELLRQAGATH